MSSLDQSRIVPVENPALFLKTALIERKALFASQQLAQASAASLADELHRLQTATTVVASVDDPAAKRRQDSAKRLMAEQGAYLTQAADCLTRLVALDVTIREACWQALRGSLGVKQGAEHTPPGQTREMLASAVELVELAGSPTLRVKGPTLKRDGTPAQRNSAWSIPVEMLDTDVLA